MEDEKRKFKPIGKTKKELVKKDIQGLKTVSQKEFNRIVDNLYSPEINFKDQADAGYV